MSLSVEIHRPQDIAEARVVVQGPKARRLRGEIEIGRARLHAVLQRVERAVGLAGRHPLDRSTFPAVGALEQGDPDLHRRLPAFGAGDQLDMLGQALGDREATQGDQALGHRLVVAAEMVEHHHAAVVDARRVLDLQAFARRLERALGMAGHPVDEGEVLQGLDVPRVEAASLQHGLDRLVVAAGRAQELAERAERLDRAAIECNRVAQVGFGAVPVPVVFHLYAAQHRPRLGECFVEGDRALGRRAGERHGLVGRQRTEHGGRRQQQVGRAEARMRHRIVGIERQRLLEQGVRLQERQAGEGLQMGARLELQEVRLGGTRAIGAQLGDGRSRKGVGDPGGDLVLQRGAVGTRLLEPPAALGPAASDVDQASGDLQPFGFARHGAFQQVPRAEPARRLDLVLCRILDGADRRDAEAAYRAERGADGIGNADAEIAVVLVEVTGRERPHHEPFGFDRRRCRRWLCQDVHRHGQAIARAGDGLDEVARPQRLAQGRHVHGESAVLDHDAGPKPGAELLVPHQAAARLDQHQQDLPCLRGDGDPPAVAREATLGGIKRERTEFIYRHGDPYGARTKPVRTQCKCA
jgi:hypothetical protein